MSSLLVGDHPRTIVIKPPSNQCMYSLVFEASRDQISATFKLSSSLNASKLTYLYQKPIFGCLGLVPLNGDVFVLVCTEANRVFEIEGHSVYNIQKIGAYSLYSSKYDKIDIHLETPFTSGYTNEPPQLEHPLVSLGKLLASGSFYFSQTFDLSRSLQNRIENPSPDTGLLSSLDMDFIWNKTILSELMRIRSQDLEPDVREQIDKCGVLIPVIQGFVGLRSVMVRGSKWHFYIISRMGSNRAGTRFNARGIDDDGQVANFVETEFFINNETARVSFTQVRGSVPVFWEQVGVQMSHKPKLSRGPESSQLAAQKHFDYLVNRYGRVMIVNLLSQRLESSEYVLTEAYKRAVNAMDRDGIGFGGFDFHAVIQRDKYERLGELSQQFKPCLEDFHFTIVDNTSGQFIQKQDGVFRVNCLDCLDRTNVVQARFAMDHTTRWFQQVQVQLSSFESEGLFASINDLWADNGDWLSRIYAGTGALKSSYTRNGKQTIAGFFDDAAKSVNRFYVSNFQDKSRQESIDLLLGKNHDPNRPLLQVEEHQSILMELSAKIGQFATFSEKIVFCGTYNLNGKMNRSIQMETWLQNATTADLVLIGVQELIELNPGAYISADTDSLRRDWEAIFMKELNRLGGGFVLLRSIHLVALGIFVFVKSTEVGNLRDVRTCAVKTGFAGMAANKGGIGISICYNDTTMAFVTAHFAAGNDAVEERNKDYWTITNGMNFKGKKLDSHDFVIWFGDFNYRIQGQNLDIRRMVYQEELQQLSLKDQLNEQRQKGLVFPTYKEGQLEFKPTYKYDNNKQDYDSSEKQRPPAWTDRILFKGEGLMQLLYQRGEMLMSDHRPVYSLFKVKVMTLDRAERARLERELYQQRKTGELTTHPKTGVLLDFATDFGKPAFDTPRTLPPPSSKTDKWWERAIDVSRIPFQGSK
ncbi:SacI homology domain-containing protein, partial [Gorgonomyces haynaldii]